MCGIVDERDHMAWWPAAKLIMSEFGLLWDTCFPTKSNSSCQSPPKQGVNDSNTPLPPKQGAQKKNSSMQCLYFVQDKCILQLYAQKILLEISVI